MENSKKKIAICLWGQTRTFRTLDNYYRSHEDFEFDYFVSTWDDFKDKTPFNFFKEKEFIDPKIINFKNNTDRAFYCIHRVNNLKSKYEINNGFIYDYVLWTRGEIEFDQKSLIKFFKDKVDDHETFEINTDCGIRYADGTIRLDADHYFGSSSLVFDIYASGWKYYFRTKGCDNLHGTQGGHHAQAFIIDKFNLNNIPYKIPHKFLFNKLKKREV